jgi:predicted DNA binding CopG/RHH family protein
MSNTKLKPVPDFASEDEEHAFWRSHDSTEYVDWSKAERVSLPNLKFSTTTISLRVPTLVLERIKVEANKRDMPYQSLIKAWLAEKVGMPHVSTEVESMSGAEVRDLVGKVVSDLFAAQAKTGGGDFHFMKKAAATSLHPVNKSARRVAGSVLTSKKK